MNSLYLWINIGTLIIPLLFSFEKKVAFFKKWVFLFPAIILTAIFFLIWDVWFVQMNIWGYNAKYLLGYYIFGLPVEEVMFFFSIPYACTFIYEWIRSHAGENHLIEDLHRWFTMFFFGIALTLLYWYNDKLYTAITCIVLSLILGTHLMVIRRRYMSWFYFAFLISIIPMLIINSILASKQVIYYNPDQQIDFTIMSSPIEDFLYNLTLLSVCIGLYEWFKRLNLRYRLRHPKQSS